MANQDNRYLHAVLIHVEIRRVYALHKVFDIFEDYRLSSMFSQFGTHSRCLDYTSVWSQIAPEHDDGGMTDQRVRHGSDDALRERDECRQLFTEVAGCYRCGVQME